MKKSFIFIFIGFTVLFLSCEEPDDPVLPYNDAMPKLIGKSVNSVDILWDETALADFQSYDIFYRENYPEEPNHHYISIPHKWQVFTSIVGLISNIEYKIYVVTNDKSGKKYKSQELSVKTYSDIPSPVTGFSITSFRDLGWNRASVICTWNEYLNLDSYIVPFRQYSIYMGLDSNFICSDNNIVATEYNSGNTEQLIVILNYSDKQNYYFKLRIYNTLGKYSESKAILLIPR
jgi:hypothetical protein